MSCLSLLTIASAGVGGSTSGKADMCDPDIIGQIKVGQSSKEDVKQLIGEPDKIKGANNAGELWKYSSRTAAHTGSGSGGSFGSSSRGQMDTGGISMSQKKCNLWVYFEANGIVRKVSDSDVAGGTGFMK